MKDPENGVNNHGRHGTHRMRGFWVLGFLLMAPAGWAQPEWLREQMEWRVRPEWKELDAVYEEGDEARILERIAANPALGRAHHPPFVTAMGWAATNGATNLLAALIRDGAVQRELKARDPSTDSSLGAAAESGWSWGVRMLLEAGADANGGDSFQGSPLFRAVSEWNVLRDSRGPFGNVLPMGPSSEKKEVIRLLLGAGANVFLGRTPGDPNHVLHYLRLPVESTELADLLLTHAIPARQTNATGDTLLHLAAWSGATNALDVLVGRGMEVQVTNRAGLTPLHWVAEAGPLQSTGMIGFVALAPEWATWTSRARLDKKVRSAVAAKLLQLGARHDVFTAAGLGDIGALEALLLSSPTSLGARDARGRTALHWAALADSVPSVDLLARKGADLGVVDGDGNTPLHLALVRWPSLAVSALLERKAPLEKTNAAGQTPLGVATYSAEAMAALLKAGAEVNPVAGEAPLLRAMQPALAMAVHRSRMPWMMLQRGASLPMAVMSPTEMGPTLQLLEAGAKVEIQNAAGQSPLEIACDAGALNLVELLVRYGAGLDTTNRQGAPVWFGILGKPPMLAYFEVPSWKYQMAEALPRPVQGMMQKAGVMPAAPGIQLVSALEYLARWGAKLTATNAAGQNALHATAASGALLRFPGSVVLGPTGNPIGGPMRRAADAAKQRIEMLRATGLSVDSRDREGNTPWLLAWRHADVEWAARLAKAGADVHATNFAGMNALHLVCLPPIGAELNRPGLPRFFGPVIAHLVKQGVDPRGRDVHGATPLHFAIAPHNPPFVAVELVEGGADPGAKDHFGLSPLDIAREANRTDLLPFLRDPLGANPYRQGLPEPSPGTIPTE